MSDTNAKKMSAVTGGLGSQLLETSAVLQNRSDVSDVTAVAVFDVCLKPVLFANLIFVEGLHYPMVKCRSDSCDHSDTFGKILPNTIREATDTCCGCCCHRRFRCRYS